MSDVLEDGAWSRRSFPLISSELQPYAVAAEDVGRGASEKAPVTSQWGKGWA